MLAVDIYYCKTKNKNKKKEKGRKTMTKKYKVNNQFYRIILTLHLLQRIQERQINTSSIIPAIINYIENFTITAGDVMLEVTSENFSLVLNIKKNNVKLITVIDKINCIAKPGTLKVAI